MDPVASPSVCGSASTTLRRRPATPTPSKKLRRRLQLDSLPRPRLLAYTVPTWLPATRDVSAPFTERIGVRVMYTPRWITKLFATSSDFTKDVNFQIEPQIFDHDQEPMKSLRKTRVANPRASAEQRCSRQPSFFQC